MNQCSNVLVGVILLFSSINSAMEFSQKFGLAGLFEHAVLHGNAEFVKKLLHNFGDLGMPLEEVGSDGKNLIHKAVKLGQEPIIKLLIEQGMGLNVFDNQEALPLSTAIMQGDIAVAKLLLESGADPNLHNSIGWTPTHIAIYKADVPILKLLISSGGNPYMSNEIINPAKWIKDTNEILCKIICARRRDESDLFFGVQLFLLDVLIKNGIGIRLKMSHQPHRMPKEWLKLIDDSIEYNGINIAHALTGLLFNVFSSSDYLDKAMSLESWLFFMNLAVNSCIKTDIRSLLYFGLLESKEAVLEQSPFTFHGWAQLAASTDGFSDLASAFTKIANKKQHTAAVEPIMNRATYKQVQHVLQKLKKKSTVLKKKDVKKFEQFIEGVTKRALETLNMLQEKNAKSSMYSIKHHEDDASVTNNHSNELVPISRGRASKSSPALLGSSAKQKLSRSISFQLPKKRSHD